GGQAGGYRSHGLRLDREHQDLRAGGDLPVVGIRSHVKPLLDRVTLCWFGVRKNDARCRPAIGDESSCEAARHVSGTDETNEGAAARGSGSRPRLTRRLARRGRALPASSLSCRHEGCQCKAAHGPNGSRSAPARCIPPGHGLKIKPETDNPTTVAAVHT